jgi:hypothetical protein
MASPEEEIDAGNEFLKGFQIEVITCLSWVTCPPLG